MTRDFQSLNRGFDSPRGQMEEEELEEDSFKKWWSGTTSLYPGLIRFVIGAVFMFIAPFTDVGCIFFYFAGIGYIVVGICKVVKYLEGEK